MRSEKGKGAIFVYLLILGATKAEVDVIERRNADLAVSAEKVVDEVATPRPPAQHAIRAA